MQKLFYFSAIVIASCFLSCNEDYDILTDRVNDLENRVFYLEELCAQMNNDILSLYTIVNALSQNDYIVNVAPIRKGGKEVGYTITFTSGNSITIYHGTDGKDGYTPVIGVKKASDGIYYWTIDGQWLTDNTGSKIKAEGANGHDGVTPQLKIEGDYWYISYDEGNTWTKLGKAKGEGGEKGDAFFNNVTQDDSNVYFELQDGTTITIPKAVGVDIVVLTYIPSYSDGNATVFYEEKSDSYVDLDFEVSPADAVEQILSSWQSCASVKAVYTFTRAGVTMVEMPIISCTGNSQTGIISVKASGENLSDEFFAGTQTASAHLSIVTSEFVSVSDYVPMVAQKEKKQINITTNKYINTVKEGEIIEVQVNTNIDFEVYIPSDINWVRQIKPRTLSATNLYFEVTPNNSDLCRNANITISNEQYGLNDTISLLQQGRRTELKIAYSTDKNDLGEWNEGLFGGDGTYVMGTSYGDNGYLMTLGNILEEKSAIVFMDKTMQIREIFIDNTVFALEYNGAIDISIIEPGNKIETEHIIWNNYKYDTRSNGDHSQQVGIINLISNLQGIYDAVKEIGDAKGFSKKGTIMYLANKTDAIRNLIKALGGPDIFNENFSNWLGAGMNISSLAELVGMYGSSGLLGPIGALISSYAGLYTTYLELYDEHINAYFGNCKAEIDKITSNTNRLNIDVNISGYEASYVNIECGVIVQEKSSSDPRYSDGASTKTVTNNGNYVFNEGNIKINTTYSCRPFLIDRDRVSLWKGFIGGMVGPLVRYGKTKNFTVECSVSTGKCVSKTANSAVVECSFTNVSGLECGVYVSSDDETKKFTANSIDGSQEITLSGLRPATTYNYWAFIEVDGIPINGQIKTFTTNPPDISGTWTCNEYSSTTGEVSNTYNIILNKDGTAKSTKTGDDVNGHWTLSSSGVVNISITRAIDSYYYIHYTGHEWNGKVDNIYNPTKITGTFSTWNYNGNGYFDGPSRKMEMTR